jgi:hypothetical protein
MILWGAGKHRKCESRSRNPGKLNFDNNNLVSQVSFTSW